MPANLPPQYFDVEEKYRTAKDPQEKITYLQQLLSIIPKHKGTEKLQAELKTKIRKLRYHYLTLRPKKQKTYKEIWNLPNIQIFY